MPGPNKKGRPGEKNGHLADVQALIIGYMVKGGPAASEW